jgi:hypothetical protein
MANSFSYMPYPEWVAKYQPIPNGTTEIAPLIYKASLEDLKKIRHAQPECVWTLLDYGYEKVIANGLHWFGNEGHFITKVPFGNEGLPCLEVAYS